MSTGDVWVCQTIRGAQGARVGKFPYLTITQTSPLPNIFTGFNKCLACRFPGYYPIATHSQAWLSRTQQVHAHLPVSGQGHSVLEM